MRFINLVQSNLIGQNRLLNKYMCFLSLHFNNSSIVLYTVVKLIDVIQIYVTDAQLE